MTTRNYGARQRKPIIVMVVSMAVLVIALLNAATANAAPQQNLLEAFRSGGDLNKIASMVMPQATPVAAVTAGLTPTPAARTSHGPVTNYIDGTGGGKDRSAIVQNGETYVVAPYPASIFEGPVMGPYSFGDSVNIGARQAVINAKANPQEVLQYAGHSQGASAAWEAAAQDGQKSHIVATGTPTNPGTGFVSVMPSNLLITDIGTPSALQPGDTAVMKNLSGDCWGNMPDFRNVLSLIACVPSTIDTHYKASGPGSYAEFKADEVYESSPGITQEVQYTENGLVLIAQQINPNLPEDQKQMLRELAPQGRPGIQSGPTLREMTNPMDMVKSAVEGAATPAVINNDAPAAAPANPVAAIAEAAAPILAQAPEPVKQLVEQWTPPAAPQDTYTAPSQSYSAPVMPAFEAPQVQQVVDSVSTAVAQFAPDAAPMINDVVGQFANAFAGR